MEESDTAISARLSRCQVSTRDFDLVALAGRGAFGKVWVVRKKNDYSGKVMAMKEMSKKDMIERGYVGHTKQEKDIMALVAGSPFIVDLYFTFHSEANLYIIMEYVPGGNLLSYVMDTEEKWPEGQCRFYGAEILLGLEYIHSKNIVYKDLKLENVLLDIDGHIRLTDFGLSKRLASDTDRVNSMSGTAAYLAPEVIDSGGKGHGTSADVWAFGVLLFTILLHESPFYSENLAELFEMILHQNIEWEYYKEDLSPEALSLLEGLLTKDISKRLGCGPNKLQEIKDHPFFAQTNWEDVLQMKVKPPIRPKLRVAERATEQDKQDLYAGHVSKKSADRGEFADFSFVAADYLQQSNEASEADQSSWSWSDDEEGFAWPFPGFLPFSAVNQIVRYLSISDISRASQVCKSWNKFLWSNIHEINLSTVQPDLFKQYWHSHICKVLKRPQRLLKMRMSPCCTDDAVAKIPSIPSLESLSFEGCSSITTTAITNLSKTTSKANSIRPKKLKFPMLGELNLSSCSGINDSALEQISKTVPLLKQLNLAFSISITDAGLSHLHRLRNLWRLDLQGLHSLSDHGIKQLVDLPNLRVLDLTGCANLTNNGVESLRTKAQQLEVLIWSDTSDPTEKGGKGMGFAQRFSKKNLFKTRDRSASTQYNVKPSMNFFKRKKKPTKRNERSASVCDSLPLSTVDSTNIDDEGNQGALSPRSRAKKLEKKIKEKMPKDRKKLKGTGDTIISPRPKKEKKLKQPKNKEKSNAIEQPIEQEDPNPPKTIPENEIDPAIPVPPGSPEAEIKQRLHKSIRDRYKKRKEAKKFDKSIMQTLLADETNIDTTPITLLDTDDPLTPRKPQDIAKLKSPRKGNEEKTNSTLTGDVPVGNKEDQPLEIPPIAIKKLSKTQEYDCPCDTSPKVLSPRSPHSPHSPHSPQSPHSRLSKSKVPKERSIGKSNQRFEDITVVAEVIPPTALSPRKESLGVTDPSISTNSEGDMLSKSATDTPIRDADFMFDEPHGDSQDGGNGTGLSKMLERVEDEHDEKRKASLVRSTI